MIAISMLLLAASSVAHPLHARHATHAVRPIRVVHVKRRTNRPMTLASQKLMVAPGCATDALCIDGKPRSPYRLPLTELREPSTKDMALAEDGTRCALVGQTICPRPTRTIFHLGTDAPTVPAEKVIDRIK